MRDHLLDVIRLVGGIGDHGVEHAVAVGGLPLERVLVDRDLRHVVVGEEPDERSRVIDRVVLVLGEVVGDTRPGVVGVRPAELLHADVFAGDGLDDVRPRDEHLGGLVDHDDEVGEGGGVDRAPRGRPHDERDLRDDSRRRGVQAEDLAVLAESDDALLNARAAGVEDADDRHPAAECELHDLDDLVSCDLAERAAEGREVLRVDGDRAPVDRADARDDGVAVGTRAVHAERARAVADVLVELDERARVDEELDALARRHLALGVLLLLRRDFRVDDGFLVPRAQVGDLSGGGGEVAVGGLICHAFHPSEQRALPVGGSAQRRGRFAVACG